MTNKNKIIIKDSKDNQKYFVVKGGNNETIVTSEMYKTTQGVNKGVKAIQKILKNAEVINKTIKPKKKS